MKAKNGTVYKNNYERTAAFFEATCASINENDAAKKAACDLMVSVYRIVGEQADKFGLKTESDAYFQLSEPQKGRETDVKTIRAPFAKITEMTEQLFTFCKCAEVTESGLAAEASVFSPKKILKSVFSALGMQFTKSKGENTNTELKCGRKCAEGLKLLSKTAIEAGKRADGTEDTVRSLLFFSRCVFDTDSDWLSYSFDYMLGAEGKIVRLCRRLSDKGYRMGIIAEGRYLSFNYVKEFGKKDEPLKRAWADKNHLGIELSYEDLCITPAVLNVRLPHFAELLGRVDEISDTAKKLIVERLKKCEACGYCVQTDKSGTRPLAAITVDGEAKCPYFASLSFRWNKVNDEDIEQIISILEAYSII